jgi:deazaflavin-dependent oxidoreductase (nitroreductase family)
MARYDRPPRQPKWLLQLQVFLLRHRLMGPFNRQFLVITTTGRITGRKIAVPIGFIRDGSSYLTLNLGGVSNWYKNARINPYVTLEVDGKPIKACAEPVPVETPEQLMTVRAAYQREQPGLFKRIFNMTSNAPTDQVMQIAERVAFMRFHPLPASEQKPYKTQQGQA